MRKPYLQCKGDHYQKQRMRCLVRDDFTCQFQALGLKPVGECTAEHPQDTLRHLVIHHIKQRQHGGTHDLDNLVTVCHAHHAEIHPHLRFEFAERVRSFEAHTREL